MDLAVPFQLSSSLLCSSPQGQHQAEVASVEAALKTQIKIKSVVGNTQQLACQDTTDG